MSDSPSVKRFGSHDNSFGFLRLFFASLVIVSHTPEMADGNRDREILTSIFHTISFGGLAVDCFFIISGYLIAGSFINSTSVWSYLKKRLARIYPAFLMASLFCIVIVAPIGGAAIGEVVARLPQAIARMAMLESPAMPGTFDGMKTPVLNGAMWTISYEFRAYLVVMLLGLLGAFRYPLSIVGLAAAAMLVFLAVPEHSWIALHDALPEKVERITLQADRLLRLTSVFLMGTVFYLYRDRIRFTLTGVGISVIGLLGCLFVPALAEPAVATFGAYLIFAFAFLTGGSVFSRINNENDISYGIYLYAWPIGLLIFWWWPKTPLVVAGLATFVLAGVAGWLSWNLVEKPIMMLIRPKKRVSERPVAAG